MRVQELPVGAVSYTHLDVYKRQTYLARAGLAHLTVVGLRFLALGLILLLLTPYNKGTFFNWTHMSVGLSLIHILSIC